MKLRNEYNSLLSFHQRHENSIFAKLRIVIAFPRMSTLSATKQQLAHTRNTRQKLPSPTGCLDKQHTRQTMLDTSARQTDRKQRASATFLRPTKEEGRNVLEEERGDRGDRSQVSRKRLWASCRCPTKKRGSTNACLGGILACRLACLLCLRAGRARALCRSLLTDVLPGGVPMPTPAGNRAPRRADCLGTCMQERRQRWQK
ncbi:hypothetical protein IWX50DRAFT_165083 [Phyllosticta citricarpa]